MSIGSLAAFMYDIRVNLFGLDINLGDLSNSLISIIEWGFGYTGGAKSENISGIWSFGTSLNTYLSTVATSLLVLFLMMEFISMCTKTGDAQSITWERILMTVAKYFMVYALYKSAPYILNTILNITHSWMLEFSKNANISGGQLSLAETIKECVNGMSLTAQLFATVMMFGAGAAYTSTAIAAIAGIFQRAVKMILLYGIAPVPIAMMAYHETSHSGKKYLTMWFSALFEGILIYIMVGIYALGSAQLINAYTSSGGTADTDGAYRTAFGLSLSISLLNAILTGGISLAGNIAKEALG